MFQGKCDMKSKPENIDEYLAGLEGEQRATLEKLRKTIQSAAPRAEEGVSYCLPASRLDGKPLLGACP